MIKVDLTLENQSSEDLRDFTLSLGPEATALPMPATLATQNSFEIAATFFGNTIHCSLICCNEQTQKTYVAGIQGRKDAQGNATVSPCLPTQVATSTGICINRLTPSHYSVFIVFAG